MNNKEKIIFHIDFDSYFCSAHRSLNSDYVNKPLAIGRKLKRSIVSSVSYELKNKGVKVGWTKNKVLAIEPKTIFIEPNFDLYITLSNKIFEYISLNFCKNLEVFSIDECWLDVTNEVKNIDFITFAKKIQKTIFNQFKIPITIGISHTKFLAKMSTNLGKPFGIFYTPLNKIKEIIWPLDINYYFGIGKPTAHKLRKININTIGDLAKQNINNNELVKIFKSRTQHYLNEAQGLGESELTYQHNDLKSIGNEVTFLAYDLDEKRDLLKILKQLTIKICTRAKNRNLIGKTITVMLRDTNKIWNSKQKNLTSYTNNENFVYKEALDLFNQLWKEDLYRGIGVRLTNLVNEFEIGKPISLFNIQEKNTRSKTEEIINKINRKFKNKIVKTGSEFQRNKIKENIQNKYLQEDLAKKN
ncbi:Y-family DNA polymerase [Mycoplasmopsis lipofaciens]|uniref:Y-family DNA polymerase n=1 Tax=Mycoplasmopsis lipofaciens TaxID=114884 RepID=UPI000488B416|nr:DNA polymerase IV [Mycoplasmopsis lipofaciens]